MPTKKSFSFPLIILRVYTHTVLAIIPATLWAVPLRNFESFLFEFHVFPCLCVFLTLRMNLKPYRKGKNWKWVEVGENKRANLNFQVAMEEFHLLLFLVNFWLCEHEQRWHLFLFRCFECKLSFRGEIKAVRKTLKFFLIFWLICNTWNSFASV